MIWQDVGATLDDEAINIAFAHIVQALQSAHNAVLRD